MKKVHNDHPNYVIYSDGRIWSNLSNKFLTPFKDKDGYVEVTLNKIRWKVHRLIASLFIENIDNKPFINHINGIKHDNRIENLEWATATENNNHAYCAGLSSTGENSVKSILTEKQVLDIRLSYKFRDSQYGCAALAKKYKVSEQTIRDIIKMNTWKHISPSASPV